MGAVTVGVAPMLAYQHEGMRWDEAGVKRAAKRDVSKHDARVQLPRSDKVMVIAAEGRGLVWEEAGRTFQAQAWCAHRDRGCYWYVVDRRRAYFPGEMRLVWVADNGGATLRDQFSYNARGHRAHRHDGSSCFGYQIGGCPGCSREHEMQAAA